MIGPIVPPSHPPPSLRLQEGAPTPRDLTESQLPRAVLKPSAPVADLTDEQRQQLQQLKARDTEVRAHEQAHSRAGGQYAGAPSYQYTRGPDGRQYAVSGEVTIDASEIPGNPKATVTKMEIVIRAALAPAEPSSQDSKVAAQARAAKVKAQAEARREDTGSDNASFVSLQERYAEYRGETARTAASAYHALETILQPQVATALDITA